MSSLSKEEILSNRDYQFEIFRYYYPTAKENKLFKIREEKTPSANLKSFKGVFFLTDFGDDGKAKNCIDLVIEKERCSFPDALKFISERIVYTNYSSSPIAISSLPKSQSITKEIKKKTFSQNELDYFGVSLETLNRFNIYSLECYGKQRSSADYFLFLYDFGAFKKINKPQDKVNRFFWVGNRPRDFIFGWDQLPENPEMIILTAGEKDAMNLVQNGFPAVSLNSESARLSKDQLNRLQKKTQKLFVCFDLDEAGRKNAETFTKEYLTVYNIKLPDELRQHSDFRGNPCKDVSDFFRHYSSGDFRKLVEDSLSRNNVLEAVDQEETGVPLFTVVKRFLKKTYDLRFNVVTNEYEYKLKTEEQYKEINESSIYVTLREKKIHVSLSDLLAILRSDFVNHYDPFLEFFESLPPWNPESDPDYIEQATTYIKMTDRNRFVTHFRKHLVRTIACALEENVFNKQAFVLVGMSQHSGKSTFCRWLCPPALKNYFAEDISTDKDSHISICENFLINLDELSTLGKTEIQALKSLFSKDKEKLRRPYDRKTSVIPRRASFIGSTDRTEFLNDEAGTVRWLCMEIQQIDFDYSIKLDINKIWCQAYYLYKSGFKYELTSEEIRENEIVNKRYQVVTIEMEIIQTYFMPGTPDNFEGFIYALKLIKLLRQEDRDLANRLSEVKLGKAFKSLGFIRGQKYEGKMQYHGYFVRFTDEYIDKFDLPYNPPSIPSASNPTPDPEQELLPF
ncbi:MAG TPA: VapE family protein [Bacteroidales bacterium]|nr:VapE family protein [Bacteroidales bacterium]HSA42335.1 VapE family protein [Bacteroidales bacterium]